MCWRCLDENGVSFEGGIKRERRRGPMQVVYLPGDREPTMLAEVIYRDSRLTWRERQAAILATDCMVRKHLYDNWERPWRCDREHPCPYCREIND